MRTSEIELILDAAYHRAAAIAGQEVRRHLRPHNLRRHPLDFTMTHGLTAGGRPVYEFLKNSSVISDLHEAARYCDNLPQEVQARLKDHL